MSRTSKKVSTFKQKFTEKVISDAGSLLNNNGSCKVSVSVSDVPHSMASRQGVEGLNTRRNNHVHVPNLSETSPLRVTLYI